MPAVTDMGIALDRDRIRQPATPSTTTVLPATDTSMPDYPAGGRQQQQQLMSHIYVKKTG